MSRTAPKPPEAANADIPLSETMGINPQDYPVARTEPASTALTQGYEDGGGFEGTTGEDYQTPFIVILQKGSPQVDEDSGSKIEGAKAGMFFNTVSGDLYDGKVGIRFIPCHRDHQFVEWIPRDDGGGFVATHPPEKPMVVALRAAQGKFGKLTMETDDGVHDLVETFYVYGILIKDDGSYEHVVLSFSSSMIKAYKNWMTMARSQTVMQGSRRITVPLFGHVYRLTAVPYDNKRDQHWSGYRVAFDGKDAVTARIAPEDPLYEAGRAFRDLAVSGVVKLAQDSLGKQDPSQGDTENF